jgi:putative DNA-invertase from lambdoid prophage Rac
MRAAIYSRVSTREQQTLGLQIEAMTAYIMGRGWELVRQVKDVGSGAKERAGREALLKAARRRELDVMLIWRLDRWGRSLPDLAVTLRELTALGVGLRLMRRFLCHEATPRSRTRLRGIVSRRGSSVSTTC